MIPACVRVIPTAPTVLAKSGGEDHPIMWWDTKEGSEPGGGERARGLPENGPEHLSQGGLIGRGQSSEFLEDEGRVEGGEDRFEQRGVQ